MGCQALFPRPIPAPQAEWSILRTLLIAIGSALSASAAVSLHQHESFQGFHDWDSGSQNPNPPAVLADSGPGGNGDASLKVTANGSSVAGGRLVVYSQSDWTGAFVSQNITSLAIHIRNGGSTPLAMRLAFNGPGGWFVTPSQAVAPFSGWNALLFDIRPTALLASGGSNAGQTMAGVTETRVLHSNTTDFRGARISSSFLMDNVRAIPEPQIASIATLAGFLLIRRQR